MERFSPGIFGTIQIHVGDSPEPFDLSKHEKGTRWRLQRVCYQVEECDINGLTVPHQSRRKFHVRGYSTLLVLWHADRQYFYGVQRLNVFCRENQRWNKERKNCRHWGNKKERKRFVLDEHVQAMYGEKKRPHTTREEPVKNHPRSPGYAQVPLAGLQSPKRFAQEYDQESDSGYYQSKKRKRTKVYHTLLMSYGELLPILV